MLSYSTFQVSEVHNRGRDTAVPCPYGNRRAIGVYFINVESAVSLGVERFYDEELRPSYVLWDENVMPLFVLEVVSPTYRKEYSTNTSDSFLTAL